MGRFAARTGTALPALTTPAFTESAATVNHPQPYNDAPAYTDASMPAESEVFINRLYSMIRSMAEAVMTEPDGMKAAIEATAVTQAFLTLDREIRASQVMPKSWQFARRSA